MIRKALPVRACDVDSAWPQVLGLIERALAKSDGGHTADDVRAKCKSGDAQLWCGIGDGLEMVAVTEIRVCPQLKFFHIWLLAGSDLSGWMAEHAGTFDEWAEKSGCSLIKLHGRLGWLKKKLPGWKAAAVVMSKEVAHGRRR